VLAHPHGPTILGARVAGVVVNGLFLSDVPHPNLLVAGGAHEHRALGVPREALHDIADAQLVGGLARRNVPELDGEVARGGGEDVFGGGVEEDLAYFPVSP
jgi:hypothetical protein